jgi:hypothetical protein
LVEWAFALGKSSRNMINILVLLNYLPVFEDALGWNLQYATRDLGDEFLARLLEAIGRFIIPQIISVLG